MILVSLDSIHTRVHNPRVLGFDVNSLTGGGDRCADIFIGCSQSGFMLTKEFSIIYA